MDLLLVCLIALAIVSQAVASGLDGMSRRRQTDASTRLVGEVSQTLRDVQEQMRECHSFALAMAEKTNEKLVEYAEANRVRTILESDGIGPFLLDPSERVAAEMEAYRQALGLTPKETIGWIRSQAMRVANAEANGNEESR